MKNKRQIKVACLQRLFDLIDCCDDVVNFLLEEKIIDKEQLKDLKIEYNKAEFLYKIIKKALDDDKLLLADFTWQVLPDERIMITFVTERQRRVFSHNY